MKSKQSPQCSVYIAASVDGFIARPDGDIDWLHNPAYQTTEKLALEYADFIGTVDALVMGRKSFEKVLTFAPWSYENVHVVVLTERGVTIPPHLAGKVSIESGTPAAIVARVAHKFGNHLYIDGGQTIRRFLQAGVIDELTITQIPILLGDGIPLFGAIKTEMALQLVESSALANGFVQNRYRVGRK